MSNQFYLRDTRSNTGSSCMFWAKGGCGYTTNLEQAEVFNQEQAQKYADEKRHFIPLWKDVVDKLATIRVDMQYLKLSTDFSDGVVIQRWCGQYDGNDIYFHGKDGKPTANYSDALVFTNLEDVLAIDVGSAAVLSKAFLDTICRPTLQAENVNHRTMMTSAGIKYKAPRKKGPTTGKTRGNCPECGKITWDYNPYENAYCSDHEYSWQRAG